MVFNHPEMSKPFLEQLNWRHAEKNFDAEKTLEDAQLNAILEATRMSPSSFGIQPYHVYVVSDASVKTKLRAAAYDQAQFTDASCLLVFASRTDHMKRVDQYFEYASDGDAETREKLKGYEDMMRGFIQNMPQEAWKPWADRQTYIALGFALAAAAELEVQSCPMEGFDTKQFDEILGLPEHMKSVVVLSLGYSDGSPARSKVRFPEDDLFTHV
jgi:nitroreductase